MVLQETQDETIMTEFQTVETKNHINMSLG